MLHDAVVAVVLLLWWAFELPGEYARAGQKQLQAMCAADSCLESFLVVLGWPRRPRPMTSLTRRSVDRLKAAPPACIPRYAAPRTCAAIPPEENARRRL